MKRGFAFVMFALVLFLSCNAAFAQISAADAQLNGSVRDQTGSMIAKAAVTLRNVDTNQIYKTTSNSVGFYILTNVPPGNYELTAESQGFAKYSQTGIVLRVAQVATIDMNLKVAGTTQEVTVNTEAPTIEPTRTEVSQVIETQQIQSLPISGRLFTDFALLSPGVTTGRISLQSTFTDPSVTRISFGGQRDLNNSRDGGRRGQHQYGHRLATRHAITGSGERVPRGEQQLCRRIRARAGRDREHRDQVRDERHSWLSL